MILLSSALYFLFYVSIAGYTISSNFVSGLHRVVYVFCQLLQFVFACLSSPFWDNSLVPSKSHWPKKQLVNENSQIKKRLNLLLPKSKYFGCRRFLCCCCCCARRRTVPRGILLFFSANNVLVLNVVSEVVDEVGLQTELRLMILLTYY